MYRVTSSPALEAEALQVMTRTRRTRYDSHYAALFYQDTDVSVEGEAKVRATTTANHPHRQEEEEGRRSQRRR
jgi:hypothetical protein